MDTHPSPLRTELDLMSCLIPTSNCQGRPLPDGGSVTRKIFRAAASAIILPGEKVSLPIPPYVSNATSIFSHPYLAAVCAMVDVAGCMQMGSIYAGERHVVKRLAAELGGEVERPASAGFAEPSLVWYASQKWTFASEMDEAADLQIVAGRRWRLDDRTLSAIWKRETPQPVKRKQGGSLDEVPHRSLAGRLRMAFGWSCCIGETKKAQPLAAGMGGDLLPNLFRIFRSFQEHR